MTANKTSRAKRLLALYKEFKNNWKREICRSLPARRKEA
jgi:hypothetical protein